MLIDGNEVENGKVCYYNRTWESYDFQTVLYNVVSKAFKNKLITDEQKKLSDEFIKEGKEAHEEINSHFKTVSMVAQMGEIFGNTKKEKNDWKTRMLKAGLENKGLRMPEDWDSLDEDSKELRLNAVIKGLKNNK